ncbi:MAG: protein kinase domain-containing protein, partial [Chthoniobacterales bacterium]
NILLREDGEPLVVDFGLAKMDGSGGGSASLSVSGHVVGTVENMAPEQAMSSKTVDGRADVFSIGTILYQLLTGHKFFTTTGNLLADAQTLQTYNPHRPRLLNKRIDPDLEIITMKALRHDRADRYRTVSALQADIERFLRGELISAKPINPGELLKKLVLRHKAITAVSAASLLILTVGLGAAAWMINDRRLAAVAAQRETEKALIETKAQRAQAEKAQKLAEKQKEASDRALAQLELARKAEQEAVGLHQRAVAEAQQFSQEKDQAEAEREKLAQLADKQADELRKTQERLKNLQTKNETKGENQERLAEARKAMDDALTNYQFEFSPKGLEQFTSAQSILKRVNAVMKQLNAVLNITPDFVPALLMKARLHIAALEMESARLTLHRAEEASKAHPAQPGAEDIPALTKIVETTGASPSGETISANLRKTGDHLDWPAANLLDALRMHASSRKPGTLTTSVFGRQPDEEEVAVNLRIANPKIGAVKATRDSAGSITIEMPKTSGAVDLSPLRGLAVHTLRIAGAEEVDWRTLHALPVVELDLGGCAISNLGMSAQNRGLLRVRSLHVAGTKIADLREIAQLPLLEDLDVSGTPVRNLLPLSGRRMLQLNIAGCTAAPLSVLEWMPLQTLVLTPSLCPELKSNPRLRASRTLRSIRAPGDPAEQTAAEFWRKLDAGDYDKPAAP